METGNVENQPKTGKSKTKSGNQLLETQKLEPKSWNPLLESKSWKQEVETEPQNPKVGTQKRKTRQVANRRRSTTGFPARPAGR